MARSSTLRRITGNEPGLEVVAGVISREPADRLDTVGVALASLPSRTIADTKWWPRDGDTLPGYRAECVLLLSPGVDPVVLSWIPDA